LHTGTEKYSGPTPAARREEAKDSVNLTAKKMNLQTTKSFTKRGLLHKVAINA
jgi:hypothetical protein